MTIWEHADVWNTRFFLEKRDCPAHCSFAQPIRGVACFIREIDDGASEMVSARSALFAAKLISNFSFYVGTAPGKHRHEDGVVVYGPEPQVLVEMFCDFVEREAILDVLVVGKER
ncbi:hypothetical protein IQ63_25940 [Streptomyces acidiscabies]|uniref:Uncharacterized protein n=1 Tax=Streptomyces acidiscabies TaxID=42234 RepID=A0A0L0K1U5_9ACTN|nr:hypothetical protein IQ63_25940 [Streptomyces acidiscabies]